MKLKILSIISLSFVLFSSCGQKKSAFASQQFAQADRRIVIWTSCREFAQYIELYNATSLENRAILVYKENPALSLPPAKDELPPDIIVGPGSEVIRCIKASAALIIFFFTKSFILQCFMKIFWMRESITVPSI